MRLKIGKRKLTLKAIFFVALFLLVFYYTKDAEAACAHDYSCYGTRVSDVATGCDVRGTPGSGYCVKTHTHYSSQTCNADCEKLNYYVTGCTYSSSTITACPPCTETWDVVDENCGRASRCGDLYCTNWSDCNCSCNCLFPAHKPCGWQCAAEDWSCDSCCTGSWRFPHCCWDVYGDVCNTCTTHSCSPSGWAWSNCANPSRLCYNCCIYDPEPPPPPPECDTNPGAPSLGIPTNGFTANDTNVISFTWSANGWGGADCAGRAFRFQIDNDADWGNGNVYDPGNLTEGTTSRNVTLNEPEGTYRWRVGAQNENNGWIWSGTRTFSIDYIPPTAEFTNPTSDITVGPNSNISFTADASDPGGAMTRMQIVRHNTANAVPPGPDQAPATLLGAEQACSGANCTLTRTWNVTSADVGTWHIYVNAYDENDPVADGKCTGSNNIPGGWGDCGDFGGGFAPGFDLITVTVQNTLPNGEQVLGPTTAIGSGAPGSTVASSANLYNATYNDVDGQIVTNRWSSPNCTINYEEIDHIDIRSSGSLGVGAWPIMEVVVGDPFAGSYGSRSNTCTFTVGSASWQTRTCNINQSVSSLDILFINDANGGVGDDRNLYIDWVDIYYTDGSVDRVQAESAVTSGTYVYIDRGGKWRTAYDGLARASASQSVPWNAAVRIPVPISFSPPSSPFTCRLQATPRDSLGAVGNTVFRDVFVCGSPPSPVTNPTPGDGEENVIMPVTTTWDAPTDWGDACGLQTNTYTVYTKVKTNPTCLPADPIGTVHGTGIYNPAGWPASTCQGLAEGNESCSDLTFNVRDTEFCWYVEANNNQFISQSEVWWFETIDPIVYQQWMTTVYGDFYAGAVSMQFPDMIDYIASWNPPHLSYENPAGPQVSTIASNDIDITTDNSTAGYHPESQSGFYVKYANFTQTWPPNYNGDPPASATEYSSNCNQMFNGNLDPDYTYKADVACVNTGLLALGGGNYSLAANGAITLYVTGNGTLRFDDVFTSTDGDSRVLFVTGTGVDIKIASSLNSGNPTTASPTLIEAAFVINKDIEFERKVGDPDPEVNPDTSIVVEGPIITRNVSFNRNRGLTNFYPSEIIKYNNYYLHRLTRQERKSMDSNYSGLFVVDVDWISEE